MEDWTNYDRTIQPEMKDFTPVRIVHGKLLIPVLVNDKRESNFLIDSGASENLVSQKLAWEVTKLRSDNRVVKGISGKVQDVKAADEVVLQFEYRQENRYLPAFDGVEKLAAVGSHLYVPLSHRTSDSDSTRLYHQIVL